MLGLRWLIDGLGVAKRACNVKGAGLLGDGYESAELSLMQIKMRECLGILLLLGLGKAGVESTGDNILNSIAVHVMEVLAGTDVAVNRMVASGRHLIIGLLIHEDTHRALFLGEQPGYATAAVFAEASAPVASLAIECDCCSLPALSW
jgi:hypothetical protein